MREILNALDPVKLETELGTIYVGPIGNQALRVHAPHLNVDGLALQFAAQLIAGPDLLNWDFLHGFDLRTQGSGIATETITARLVDGRDADLMTLGKVAQVVIPAVRKLAGHKPWFLPRSRAP